jgi:hypothetical protein
LSASNASCGVSARWSRCRSGAPIAPHSSIGSRSRIQHDLDLLRQLLGLHERQHFEHLVQRAEAARKDHQCLGHVREPELPHEEVVELEVQAVSDVRIGPLLEGQPDVETDGLATRLFCAPVGRLHDARSAARGDDEAVVRRSESERPFRQQLRELTGLFVIPRPLDCLAPHSQLRLHLGCWSSLQAIGETRHVRIGMLTTVDPSRAEEDDRVLDVLLLKPPQGLEVLRQNPQGARFVAVKKLAVVVRQ